jgi:hypothetical protein
MKHELQAILEISAATRHLVRLLQNDVYLTDVAQHAHHFGDEALKRLLFDDGGALDTSLMRDANAGRAVEDLQPVTPEDVRTTVTLAEAYLQSDKVDDDARACIRESLADLRSIITATDEVETIS